MLMGYTRSRAESSSSSNAELNSSSFVLAYGYYCRFERGLCTTDSILESQSGPLWWFWRQPWPMQICWLAGGMAAAVTGVADTVAADRARDDRPAAATPTRPDTASAGQRTAPSPPAPLPMARLELARSGERRGGE